MFFNILDWQSFNEAYNKPRVGSKRWSIKYKKKINCNNPKGFSQKQYCKRKKRGGNYKAESNFYYFESISNIDEIRSNLRDFCLEFTDNECETRIEYHQGSSFNYIEIDTFESVKSNSFQWYDREVGINVQIFALPDWFISNCRRIEDYMQSEGFTTKPSIKKMLRYALDWKNLESIGELANQQSLIYKVRLEFLPK